MVLIEGMTARPYSHMRRSIYTKDRENSPSIPYCNPFDLNMSNSFNEMSDN